MPRRLRIQGKAEDVFGVLGKMAETGHVTGQEYMGTGDTTPEGVPGRVEGKDNGDGDGGG